MSHAIVKSMKWVGDGVELFEADSNATVTSPSGREMHDFYHYKWKTTLEEFYEYLFGGMIKPYVSANGYKWSYAILHLTNEVIPWYQTWDKVKDDPKNFEWFKNYIEGKTREPKGKFALKVDMGGKISWIVKINKKCNWVNPYQLHAKAFPYRKACVLAKIAEEQFCGLAKVKVVRNM